MSWSAAVLSFAPSSLAYSYFKMRRPRGPNRTVLGVMTLFTLAALPSVAQDLSAVDDALPAASVVDGWGKGGGLRGVAADKLSSSTAAHTHGQSRGAHAAVGAKSDTHMHSSTWATCGNTRRRRASTL